MGIKYQVNEEFFTKWSRDMAYVLGYIYADGSVEYSPYIRARYLRFGATDREIISKMKRFLRSEHPIIKKEKEGRKTCYLLRIGSHKIYNSLIKIGVQPNKALTMNFPSVPHRYLGDFIRGYFDGDGCVYIERTKGQSKKIILRRVAIIFTSGSKIFLKKLEQVLRREVGVKKKKIYDSRRSVQLRYNTDDSIEIFKFMYKNINKKSYLKRKLHIFKKYFKLRPQRVDKEIETILEY